jgi:hypothetical protein
MFVVVQFPFADFRPFSDSTAAARSLTPSWPPRTRLPAQFLRRFGRACDRYRGVDYAWTDEKSFCRANRALRFPALPLRSTGWERHVHCAFRRLFSDGLAVARLEAGFAFESPIVQQLRWQSEKYGGAGDMDLAEYLALPGDVYHADPLEVLTHIALLPTIVPRLSPADSAATMPRALAQQGGSLAELYFKATSRLPAPQVTALGREWLRFVGQGAPVLLAECNPQAIERLPQQFARMSVHATTDVSLAFGKLRTAYGMLDAWLIGCSRSNSDCIRNLRLCLLRLHAEQQALALVLDRLSSGVIEYQPGSGSGDRLERYLNQATRLIDRKAWADIQQSEILAAFDAQEATEHSATSARLGEQLEGMRLQVRRKVMRFHKRAVTTIQIAPGASYVRKQTMQEKVIHIGAGTRINAPVVIADSIQNAFNTLTTSRLDDRVKALMEQLLTQVAEVARQAPRDRAQELGENAEVLAKEIVREKPRRKWYELSAEGLKEAAEAIGQVGKPILETVSKLLPLLIVLWP